LLRLLDLDRAADTLGKAHRQPHTTQQRQHDLAVDGVVLGQQRAAVWFGGRAAAAVLRARWCRPGSVAGDRLFTIRSPA